MKAFLVVALVVLLPRPVLCQTTEYLIKDAPIAVGDTVVVLRPGWLRTEPTMRSSFIDTRTPLHAELVVDSVLQETGHRGRAYVWIKTGIDGMSGWLNQSNRDIIRRDAWTELLAWQSSHPASPAPPGKSQSMILGEESEESATEGRFAETLIFNLADGRYGFAGIGTQETDDFRLDGKSELVWEFVGSQASVRLIKLDTGATVDLFRSTNSEFRRVELDFTGRYRLSVESDGTWTVGIVTRLQ
jgi:hypothetical protein